MSEEKQRANTTTQAPREQPVVTIESIRAAIAHIDSEGRLLAEAVLIGKLRQHPVEMTRLLANTIPEPPKGKP